MINSFLLVFLAAIVGQISQIVLSAKDYFLGTADEPFDIKILVSENLKSWIYGAIVIFGLLFISTFIPESAKIIGGIIGFDVSSENLFQSFLFGFAINRIIKKL